ncbi:hypothetical protein DFH01_16815 [Falsiroseomonas bella]|uniref:Uncharacterized protein n=1 Tax=Falsiroseomonas bella TaxID=2184016 RepID=A0A317FCG2_9PROT|nr:hypothetical protein [Falsiroseomonas bella]PWS36790.1 hypothetical protein DFH01_16815 [Falsiroseomonas bella]
MIEGLIAWLVATFLLGPIQAQVTEQLQGARAPVAVVQQVAQCAAQAAPQLVARAGSDPWWAVRTALGAWTGATSPEAVLADAAPGCGAAFQAARPYLAGS